MAEKTRFRVKKLGAPEYAPETAGVWCGSFKLEYGKQYNVADEESAKPNGEVLTIARRGAVVLEKAKLGKFA